MKLIVICGATATGKSDLAISVAQKIDAEIINADSMQLYKGMDIGTAKLTMQERRGIPHHLIDVLPVNQEASVAQYQIDARSIIDQLLEENIPAIVVGGTGLYIKAILDDLNFPDTDAEVREKIARQAEELGIDVMHERLLFRIERIAQRAEECRIGRVRRDMRAGDVSRVSERRSTRIDQQRPPG